MSTPAPHSPEAERALIGSVLLDNTLIDELAYVPTIAFYGEKHRLIWAAVQRLVAEGSSVDIVTLNEHLRLRNESARAGGPTYVIGAIDATPTSAYAHDYAHTVLEHHQRRQLISLCMQTAKEAETGTAESVMVAHEVALTNLSRFNALERGPADYHREALDLITGANAASTGFVDLDLALGGGLMRGGYNVIAARASMGKSALLRRILTHRASRGEKCSLFSIDQGGGEIYAFEAALRCGVALWRFRPDKDGVVRATARDRERYERALDDLRDTWSARVRVHDSRADMSSVLARARADIRDGCTLIAIDHLQSILVDGKSDETNIVSNVSRTLKALCREHNVTLVLVSQLSRAAESERDKRPSLRHLRQSGAIEEDANCVLFLYRDDYYQTLANPYHEPDNEAEVIVAKNKMGPVPSLAKLTWRPEFATFESMATPAQRHRAGAN